MDLRDRLWEPVDAEQLPDGWEIHEKIASAGGVQFAGDFMVAHRSDDVLDLVLVDVCGKGVAAGTRALQFSGALNGLVGSLPPLGLMSAANDYLLRQDWLDGFATAVHIEVGLQTGDFTILNAGHPPVLWWCAATREWLPDVATGLALGIEPRPDFNPTRGHLEPGDALLAVTDGIVETHEHDVIEGIEWLKEVASEAISPGFEGAPGRIIAKVAEANDDRAVVLIHRLEQG
jgi:serine phosphatase RsbU (regulator of sigma subunit)